MIASAGAGPCDTGMMAKRSAVEGGTVIVGPRMWGANVMNRIKGHG